MQQTRDQRYRRLQGSLHQPRDSRGRTQALWLAADHLLLVQTGHFVQTTRRVELRDVEAVTQRATATYAWTNALAAIPCAVGACLLVAAPSPWSTFGICLAAPCLLILLANLLLGQTCECHLQTRACTHALPALCRYRYARRVLPVLARHIEAAQAGLPAVAEGLLRTRVAGPTLPSDSGQGLPRGRHAVHALFYGLLAVQAVAFLLVIRFTTVATLLGCVCSAVALLGVALFSAVFQHRVPIATRLRVVTWLAAAGVLCGAFAGYVFVIFAVVTQSLVATGLSMSNQADQLALRYAQLLARDGLPTGLRWALLAAAVLAALVALLGFAVFLTVPPAAAARASPSPPPRPPAETA